MKKVKEEESESMKDIIVDYPLRDEIVQQRALNVKHSERNNLPISWSVKSDPEVRMQLIPFFVHHGQLCHIFVYSMTERRVIRNIPEKVAEPGV